MNARDELQRDVVEALADDATLLTITIDLARRVLAEMDGIQTDRVEWAKLAMSFDFERRRVVQASDSLAEASYRTGQADLAEACGLSRDIAEFDMREIKRERDAALATLAEVRVQAEEAIADRDSSLDAVATDFHGRPLPAYISAETILAILDRSKP